MKNEKLFKIVLTSVFAALACVATMIIQIPTPMNGYINIGDCIVILSGWLLGPVYGFCAAAIGSAFADIFAGYAYYAVGTFVIKGAMAMVCGIVYNKMQDASTKKQRVFLVLSAVLAEVIMVVGYFLYASLIFGEGFAALASVPANLIQGVGGIIGSVVLYQVLDSVKALKLIKN